VEQEWQSGDTYITLRSARNGEERAIMEFLAREFHGGWEYEAGRYLQAGGDPSDILLALAGAVIAGFCRTFTGDSLLLGGSTHWFPLLRERWGGLGPMGISAAFRGRGLGLALLRYSVGSLKRRGVSDAVIDWTVLRDFYARVGFAVWKQYWQGSKPLEARATMPQSPDRVPAVRSRSDGIPRTR
jgi:predicted N-acetyltransferase YhbS